jgi:hypothetical protein
MFPVPLPDGFRAGMLSTWFRLPHCSELGIVQSWAFEADDYVPTGVMISTRAINLPGALAATPPGGL